MKESYITFIDYLGGAHGEVFETEKPAVDYVKSLAKQKLNNEDLFDDYAQANDLMRVFLEKCELCGNKEKNKVKGVD